MMWLLLSNERSETGHLSTLKRGRYETHHTAVWPADRLRENGVTLRSGGELHRNRPGCMRGRGTVRVVAERLTACTKIDLAWPAGTNLFEK